nr:zinc ribbon domain-containing protein [uncultured Undibacterium sp.]
MSYPSDNPLSDATKACPKCGSYGKTRGEFRAAGGFWSSFFDYSNKRFQYLSCKKCGYTEFYNSSISGAAKFIDFLGGG